MSTPSPTAIQTQKREPQSPEGRDQPGFRTVTIGASDTAVPVWPPLFLAPMAGVTDRDFRLIVRRIGGIGVVAMEFISSKAIVSGNKKTRELMHFVPEERPLAIQIYGSNAATMAEAARVVEELGADICDINMGCPANKVLKGCAGAALMADLKLAEDIITSCRKVLSIPLRRQVPAGHR